MTSLARHGSDSTRSTTGMDGIPLPAVTDQRNVRFASGSDNRLDLIAQLDIPHNPRSERNTPGTTWTAADVG
jgi:hypothetical protein